METMNVAHAYAANMAGLGDVHEIITASNVGIHSGGTFANPGSWLGRILTGVSTGLQTVLNPNPLYNQSTANLTPQQQQIVALRQQGYTDAQIQAILSGQNPGGGGVGFGLDGQGIRLSDGTHITWTTIALAGAAFFLLQSKPVRRS